MFTVNNPDKKALKAVKKLRFNEDVQYCVFQGEKGQNGTPHLQGFIQFKKKKRRSAVQSLLGGKAHLELRRGTVEQAMAYPKKEDTYSKEVHERVEWGEPNLRDKQGKRTDLDRLAEDIKGGATVDQIMTSYPKHYVLHRTNIRGTINDYAQKQERSGHKLIILFGDAGSGKSYTGRRLVQEAAGEGVWEQVAADLSDYGQKNTPRHVLIEEFKGNIKLSDFKQLFDPGSTRPPLHQRYANVNYLAELTIITSNYHPATWYDLTPTDACAFYRRITECWEFRGVYDAEDPTALTITKHPCTFKNTTFENIPEWFSSQLKLK